MEQREIEVTVLSAQNLKKVNTFGKMSVYCVAWVYPHTKVSSPMDTKGNTNPTWNAILKLTVDERLVQDGNAVLMIDLYNHGSFGNKHVGSCSIPLSGLKGAVKEKDHKEDTNEGKEEKAGSSSSSGNFLTLPVLRPSGKAKGTMNVSVKQGELLTYPHPPPGVPVPAWQAPGSDGKSDAPVYAYPATAYPPAFGQPGAAQPYPMYQQAPYYPPAGNAPQPAPRRSGGMSGGLGAGLVGGALGGLLIGSMLGGGCGGCGGF